MEGFAIGAGLGLAGILLVVTVGYILNYRLVNSSEKHDDERKSAEDIAKHEAARAQTLDANVLALRGEISSLKTRNEMLAAQLQAVEKEANDLLHAIGNDQPSALPVALRAQLDRLRTAATPVPAAATSTTSGDQNGGDSGGVHGGDPAKRDPG